MIILKTQTLNFLGRGSAFNTNEGSNSAFIKDNDTLFLIDCGEDTFSKIIKFNILENIKNIHIFITHTHSDHYGSLSSLIYYARYIRSIIPHVYCTDENLFTILNISGHKDEYIKHLLLHNEVITVSNNLCFKSIPVKHTNTLSSSGLIINYLDKTIYFSGDCNELLTDAIDKIRSGHDIEYYQDTSTFKTPVHLHIDDLTTNTLPEDRDKIFCMHIEGNDIFKIAKENNLKIVELFQPN